MIQQQLAVETAGPVKRYDGDVLAVDGLDLKFTRGTAYVLLGPNGAGKTTTISVLTTLLEPTSGRAEVSGFDVLRDTDGKADALRLHPCPGRATAQRIDADYLAVQVDQGSAGVDWVDGRVGLDQVKQVGA